LSGLTTLITVASDPCVVKPAYSEAL
jgi:hypothetical protein